MRNKVARRHLSATEVRNLRTLLLTDVLAPQEIGRRIKAAREEAGLRQEDLADLVGLGTRTIQNYEAGSTKPYTHLRKIAAALNVNVDRLLHDEDVQSPPLSERLDSIELGQEAILMQLERLELLLLEVRQGSETEPGDGPE